MNQFSFKTWIMKGCIWGYQPILWVTSAAPRASWVQQVRWPWQPLSLTTVPEAGGTNQIMRNSATSKLSRIWITNLMPPEKLRKENWQEPKLICRNRIKSAKKPEVADKYPQNLGLIRRMIRFREIEI